jgi:hypothetical protein
MYLRWCVALLSAVSFSYSQDSKGIDSPGPSAHQDSSLYISLKSDSTAAKTDSNGVISVTNSSKIISDSINSISSLSVSDGNNSPDKCGLQISCFPDSATVFISNFKGSLTSYSANLHFTQSTYDCKAGLTPFKKWGFQEGYYEISIQKEGWEEFKQVVYLKNGQMTPLECHLTCLNGYLQIKSDPQGATIFLNKNRKGITPITLTDLRPGLYSLRLELAKFAPAEMLVSVVKDSKTSVNKTLLTQKAMDSLRVIKLKRAQNVRRFFFAAAGVACASAGYYFNNKVDNLLDKEKSVLDSYNNLKSGTTEASFDAAWVRYINALKQTNAATKKRNLLYKASALFTAGFIISIPF